MTYVAKPNYKIKCEVCQQSPTVDVYDGEGDLQHSTGLCGVCTWGEAACLDPENW